MANETDIVEHTATILRRRLNSVMDGKNILQSW